MTDSQTLLDTPTTGLGDVQRAAFFTLFKGMENALSEIQDYWELRDSQFNTVTGADISLPIELEAIPAANFHEGHKPSLINGTPDSYPNVSVFSSAADPNPESDRFDQMDSFLDLILIETMVKGQNEDETNRRIQRTVDAVVMCIRRNPTLGGAVTGLYGLPTIRITDLFAIKSPSQSGGYGARWLWQGAQITFRVPKDSVMPLSGPGTFAGASNTDYSQYIDQG